MTHFDLFSGYGGFTLALERAYENKKLRIKNEKQSKMSSFRDKKGQFIEQYNKGSERFYNTIGFSETDKYATAVLKFHWPKIKNYGDITKIDWSKVPDFDLLTGGSPCQDLSIAGKRAGLKGKRSGLFYEFMRALHEKKPRYFIWENVKGAISSQSGFDFATVITEMAEAGYSLWWQVLNAKNFGVPQNRERIFVFGFRDESPREIFFERGTSKENNEISFAIDANYSKGCNRVDTGRRTVVRTYKHGFNQGIIKKLPNLRSHSGAVNNEVLDIEGIKLRRLTPTECERLMGLSDNWTSKGIKNDKLVDISDSQRYKLCGNGVVVNVVLEIIKSLLL